MPDAPKVTPMWAVYDGDGIVTVRHLQVGAQQVQRKIANEHGEETWIVAGVFVPMPVSATMVERAAAAMYVDAEHETVWEQALPIDRNYFMDVALVALTAALTPEGA